MCPIFIHDAGLLIRSQRLPYVKVADFPPSSAGRAASREEYEEWSESSGESSVSYLLSCSPVNIFQDDDKTVTSVSMAP